MKFKKLVMPISIAATVAPIVVLVSCNGNTETVKQDDIIVNTSSSEGEVDKPKTIESYSNKAAKFQIFNSEHQSDLEAISYDTLKANVDQNLPWAGGIAKFALSQGSSYLYNLALKLGFKEEITDVEDLSTVDASDKLSPLKKEAFTAVKDIFDNLKTLDATTIKTITGKEYFQNVFLLEGTGNQMDERKLISNGIDVSTFGLDVQKSIQSPNGKLTSLPKFSYTASTGEDVHIVSEHMIGSQYIDANKPGTVNTILEMAPTVDDDDNILVNAFSKKLSVDGLVPVYPMASDNDKKHNLSVIDATLQKVSLIFASENDNLVKNLRKSAYGAKVTNIFIDALEFLGKNFDKSYSMTDVEKAYDSLNNGSHYFKAVEVFFRGTEDVNFARNTSVQNWLPQNQIKHNGLIDTSIDHLEATLLPWGGRQGNGSFFFKDNGFVLNYDFNNFKPAQK